jgi:zinc protease
VILLFTTVALAGPALPPVELLATQQRLENGLLVVVHEDHRAPLAAVHVRYDVGAGDEGPGEAGLAHLFEHLMFGGSEHAPNGAYDALLAGVGGENNAWTDHEQTVYHSIVPREALDLVLFLESDRMGWLAGGLTEEKLENQRQVVAGEAAEGAARPGGRDIAALNAAIHPPGHPDHLPVIGDPASLAALTVEDLASFHHRWYGPGNATLVIAGDVDTSDALASVKRWFGEIPAAAPPARAALQATVSAPVSAPAGADGSHPRSRRWTWTDHVPRETLFLAWPTVPRGHADEPALDLLSQLLASGRGTRLPDRLVYRRRGLDSVEAWTDNGRNGGLFVIQARATGEPLESVRRQVDRALEHTRLRGPTEVELERHRVRWHAGVVRRVEGLEARAHELSMCAAAFGEAACTRAELERYDAVTVADLHRVLERWLAPERRVELGVMAPERAGLALDGAEALVLP